MLCRRVTMRFYLLLLCLVYFTMLYVFYGRLQIEMSQNMADTLGTNVVTTKKKTLPTLLNIGVDKRADIKRHVLETRNEEWRVSENLSSIPTSAKVGQHHYVSSITGTLSASTCFVPSNIPNRTFQALDPSTFVYSAYLDERYTMKFIRVMALFNIDKKNKVLHFFCTFLENDNRTFRVKATVYEMCENHGKLFGGYILSCEVPGKVTSLCRVNMSMDVLAVHHQYKPPPTHIVTLPVTQLKHRLPHTSTPTNHTGAQLTSTPIAPTIHVPYNFTICVPPLFGKIDTIKFVEFIEMNRILGFQHFIFYLEQIENPEIISILEYYKRQNIVTMIDWNLPAVTQKGKIWYNGQLNAHNDCLYRAMTITQFVAIIDIDEYIVPHDGSTTISKSVKSLFSPSVCGLSFSSAFYDPKFTKLGPQTKLVTISRTGRSTFLSKVRTKVLVKPERVFEVGIHHISKPAQEWYKVVKVNMSTAFLHHYRSCVPNYGMKCGQFTPDRSLLKHEVVLSARVTKAIKDGLSKEISLS